MARERDDLDEVLASTSAERFLHGAPCILERIVGDRIAHVDEKNGAHALRFRRAEGPGERERHRKEEEHAKSQRQEPLRPREIRERTNDGPDEERRDREDHEEAGLAERERRSVLRPLE